MVLTNSSFLLKFIIFLKILSFIISSTPIELSDYNYPSPEEKDNIKYIAIMGTNDIHGEIFPNVFQSPEETTLLTGGATNIYSYVKAMRKEWGEYFLWFDGGDQFQGTMECMLSDGSIMKDYYNYVNLNAIAIGNHEFDYGIEKLKEHIKSEKFPTLCANLYDKKNKKYIWEEGMWENVKPYQIYTLGTSPQIKIGVIGLATEETTLFTATDLSDYVFDNYFDVTKRWTDYLRNEQKVDAVILLTHFGPRCPLEPIEKMELGMRDKSTFQKECESEQEIMGFLKKIESEELKVDALIGAHVHDVVHHWIHGVPCIESSGAGYFNVLYLPFKINGDKVTLVNENIQIEGPVPVCAKIWEDTKSCNYKEDEPATNMKEILFHNSILEVDQGLIESLDEWYQIIKPKMENILATTSTDISSNGEQETILTNLINDIGRSITGADICFYNLGGLRHSWHKGGITEIDVFKMFPFNNTWNMFEMTGEEVIRMFKELNSNIIYPATGIAQTYIKKNMKNILRDIELWDGIKKTKIELDKTYRICTNNFLAEGGTGMSKIRQWYDLRNLKECGIIRDSMIDYFKNMKIINKEFFIDSNNPNLIFLENQE